MFVLLFIQPAQAKNKKIGIVHGFHVNLRKGPEISAPIVGKIQYKGTVVEILAIKDKWFYIQYNLKKAWIYADLVRILPDIDTQLQEADPKNLDQIIDDSEKLSDTSGRTYFDLGVFAFEDNDYKNAISFFMKAIKINPDDPEYHHYLGKAYLKMKSYDLAKKYLTYSESMLPNQKGLNKDLAILYYQQSDIKSASDLFNEIIRKNPSDIMSTYYAGICLYKQKDYYQAAKFFQKAGKASPTLHTNCLYYAGICHIKTSHPEKARKLLMQVRDNPKAGSLQDYARKWIQVLDKKMDLKKPYRLNARLGYQYDTNIRLEPIDEDLYTDEDDFCTRILLSGNYKIVDLNPYQISAGMVYFQHWYNEYTQYNMSGNMYNINLKIHLNPVTIRFNLSPSWFWLDSKAYLTRYTFQPSFSVQLTPRLTGTLSFAHKNDNNENNDDRDAEQGESSLSFQYFTPKRKFRLFSKFQVEAMNAESIYNNYERLISEVGININKVWGFNFGLSGQYNQKKYKEIDPFYMAIRDDHQLNATFFLHRPHLYRFIGLKTEFKYTKNSSNINIYNYKRSVVTFSLTANL